jgi:hypothetical protein
MEEEEMFCQRFATLFAKPRQVSNPKESKTTPSRKNIVSHFRKLFKRGLKRIQ